MRTKHRDAPASTSNHPSRQRVQPQVFGDVYGHLLLTIDDDEFYVTDQAAVGPAAFVIDSVIAIAGMLKDIAVELFMSLSFAVLLTKGHGA